MKFPTHGQLRSVLLLLGILALVFFKLRSGSQDREALTLEPSASELEPKTVIPLTAPGLLSPVAPEESAEPERAPVSLEPEPRDAFATISVHLTRQDNGLPIPNCAVEVKRAAALPAGSVQVDEVLTDAAGRCRIEVPAGVGVLVLAGGPSRECSGEWEEVDELVEALEEGAVFELSLALPPSTFYWGKVVDESTRAPLVGVLVKRAQGSAYAQSPAESAEVTRSDSTGTFRLPQSEDGPIYLLEAEGYGAGLVLVNSAHPEQSRAQILPLRPAATLAVRAFQGGIAGLGEVAIVSWTTASYQLAVPDDAFLMTTDPVWMADLSLDGRCEIELPSRMPLRAAVFFGGEKVRIAEAITLEPGERHEVEWRFGEGVEVEGRLLDQDEVPLAKTEIWLSHREVSRGAGKEQLFFYGSDGKRVTAKTVTDDQGRFRFKEVPIGSCWVGPAALRGRQSSLAPLAQRVQVPAAGLRNLELRGWRGLTIRGLVYEPDGSPAARKSVQGSGIGLGGFVQTYTETDGSFSLGGVGPGEWRLQAGSSGEFAGSEPVIAQAGEEGIVLQLREAGSIRGHLVDSSPLGDAEVWVCSRENSSRRGESVNEEAEFHSGSLEPGIYDLAATTSDGRVGTLEGVEVVSGKESGPVRIELHEGARMTLRYTGPTTWANFDVFAGEVPVAFDGIHTGTSATHTVPAGQVRVVVRTRSGLEKSEVVTFSPGEVREVVFEF